MAKSSTEAPLAAAVARGISIINKLSNGCGGYPKGTSNPNLVTHFLKNLLRCRSTSQIEWKNEVLPDSPNGFHHLTLGFLIMHAAQPQPGLPAFQPGDFANVVPEIAGSPPH